jgi:hypothetical protein
LLIPAARWNLTATFKWLGGDTETVSEMIAVKATGSTLEFLDQKM